MIHGRLGSIAVCIAHFSLLSAMDIDRNHRAAYPNCGMADSVSGDEISLDVISGR